MSAQPCIHCGNPLRAGAKFCPKCGKTQVPAQPIAPPLAPVAGGSACPHCHFVNPPGAKFCNQCGKKFGAPIVPGLCPKCKTQNAPTAAFCASCGKALRASRIAFIPADWLIPPKIWWLLGLGGGALILLASLTWVLLNPVISGAGATATATVVNTTTVPPATETPAPSPTLTATITITPAPTITLAPIP